ncbi:MAG TPA: HAD family hydrolase [Lutibacter sp.]|nr:HAD family hydrolase [Lutibacter sp.]
MSDSVCYHCGLDCGKSPVEFNDKCFCCNGCKTVYEILNQNELSCYYDLEQNPGTIPKEIQGKFDYLDNEEIAEKLIEFTDGTTSVVEFYIPSIHCSACIWVLENLGTLNPAILNSLVNFPNKTVRINFKSKDTSLKDIVELLTSIAYEPYISLEDADKSAKKVDKTLMYQLGIAAFGFGNVMLLAFPEYFETEGYWLDEFKYMFRWMMLTLSIPVVLYSAKDYFVTAYKGLIKGILSVDVPIALGIIVIFLRSSYEVIADIGPGYFDSLTGLIFFLLLGKVFQQKTYNYLSFERDYKSYFPIAVTKIVAGKEESVPVQDINEGDRLLIRNEELIPIDAILINGEGLIDYSFVTGESEPVYKGTGDKVFAGGKQTGGAIEIDVINKMSESYLTELWSNDIFNKDIPKDNIKNLTNRISKYFTITIVTISVIAGVYWAFIDLGIAANVVTAVLIIACPCALALAAPFAMGNMLRIFGYRKFYLKNDAVIEEIDKITHIIFDKTGTLTTNEANELTYVGDSFTTKELVAVKSLIRSSNHPLSRALNSYIKVDAAVDSILKYQEVVGKGISGELNNLQIKIGSANFVNATKQDTLNTTIYIKINETIKGYYKSKNIYRKQVASIISDLGTNYKLSILSGDNDGEKAYLQSIFPKKTNYLFNQKPQDKLDYIKILQDKGEQVMMIGDGLNDAGALAQSNVGIAISEDINVFSPACDGILDASLFEKLPTFLSLSKKTIRIIKWSFRLSFLYNFVGMYFAITNQLTPLVAAILMPLSSITIVIFVTLMTNLFANKR